jgi:alkanesulfonate monooxygenase SsuD/methylene tetrahydromethanopterin reductase-like flavin-dependent oxidoreductase (luciferase family)
MGSSSTNFYNRAFARQGYGEDVEAVQRLWQAGDHDGARNRVPVAIGLGTNLIGPPDVIRDRLRRYAEAGVDTLRLNPMGDDLDTQLDGLGRLLDLVADVNAEA